MRRSPLLLALLIPGLLPGTACVWWWDRPQPEQQPWGWDTAMPETGSDSGFGDSTLLDSLPPDTATDSTVPLVGLVRIDVACRPTDGTWTYEAWIDGPTGSLALDIVETGAAGVAPLSETHAWDPPSADPFQEADHYAFLALAPSATAPAYTSGDDTAFRCGVHNATNATWRLALTDADGLLDCAVWGHDPEHFLGQPASADCTVWAP